MTACFFFSFGMSYSEGVRGSEKWKNDRGAGGLAEAAFLRFYGGLLRRPCGKCIKIRKIVHK